MLDTYITITFTNDFNGQPIPSYGDRQYLKNTLPCHVRQFDRVSLLDSQQSMSNTTAVLDGVY
jgi:hypothetical protein